MMLTDYTVIRVLTGGPVTSEEREAVSRVIRELAGTSVSDAPHVWQEYNTYGNTCHYPGCTKGESEH